MIKAIIFDFDGVIHDTFDFHRGKIRDFAGISLSEKEYRDIHNGNFFENKNNKLNNVDWVGYLPFIFKSIISLKMKLEIKDMLMSFSKSHRLFIISSGGKKTFLAFWKTME